MKKCKVVKLNFTFHCSPSGIFLLSAIRRMEKKPSRHRVDEELDPRCRAQQISVESCQVWREREGEGERDRHRSVHYLPLKQDGQILILRKFKTLRLNFCRLDWSHLILNCVNVLSRQVLKNICPGPNPIKKLSCVFFTS